MLSRTHKSAPTSALGVCQSISFVKGCVPTALSRVGLWRIKYKKLLHTVHAFIDGPEPSSLSTSINGFPLDGTTFTSNKSIASFNRILIRHIQVTRIATSRERRPCSHRAARRLSLQFDVLSIDKPLLPSINWGVSVIHGWSPVREWPKLNASPNILI